MIIYLMCVKCKKSLPIEAENVQGVTGVFCECGMAYALCDEDIPSWVKEKA